MVSRSFTSSHCLRSPTGCDNAGKFERLQTNECQARPARRSSLSLRSETSRQYPPIHDRTRMSHKQTYSPDHTKQSTTYARAVGCPQTRIVSCHRVSITSVEYAASSNQTSARTAGVPSATPESCRWGQPPSPHPPPSPACNPPLETERPEGRPLLAWLHGHVAEDVDDACAGVDEEVDCHGSARWLFICVNTSISRTA